MPKGCAKALIIYLQHLSPISQFLTETGVNKLVKKGKDFAESLSLSREFNLSKKESLLVSSSRGFFFLSNSASF